MKIRRLLTDFKAFALQGNVLNLAVGVMIGGAFGKIITSLVNDIFTPILGLITGGVRGFSDFSGLFIAMDGQAYESVQAAAEKGVGTLNYGAFITNVIDFFLMAFCIFLFVLLVKKIMPKPKEAPQKVARQCPFCMMEVNEKATRCPHCTSRIDADAVPPGMEADQAQSM